MKLRPVTILEKSILPMGIITFTSLAIPGFIILFSVINPNLLHPVLERIYDWQIYSMIGLVSFYAPTFFYVIIWRNRK